MTHMNGSVGTLAARHAREEAGASACSVRSLTAGDCERWNAYVQSHPEATFFHLCEWERVLRQAFSHRVHYLYAESGGQLVGVLPLAEVKSLLFGHALISTPFCVYGGILASDAAAHRELERAACD